MSAPVETRSVSYWVYSPFGDAILCVPDHAEALAYAQEVEGRTLTLVVEATSRTALPVLRASPAAGNDRAQDDRKNSLPLPTPTDGADPLELRKDSGSSSETVRQSSKRTAPDDGAPLEKSWRCFQCDAVFTDERAAGGHFGRWPHHPPACAPDTGLVALTTAYNLLERDYHQLRATHDAMMAKGKS